MNRTQLERLYERAQLMLPLDQAVAEALSILLDFPTDETVKAVFDELPDIEWNEAKRLLEAVRDVIFDEET